jgi:hypothetical protein
VSAPYSQVLVNYNETSDSGHHYGYIEAGVDDGEEIATFFVGGLNDDGEPVSTTLNLDADDLLAVIAGATAALQAILRNN